MMSLSWTSLHLLDTSPKEFIPVSFVIMEMYLKHILNLSSTPVAAPPL